MATNAGPVVDNEAKVHTTLFFDGADTKRLDERCVGLFPRIRKGYKAREQGRGISCRAVGDGSWPV